MSDDDETMLIPAVREPNAPGITRRERRMAATTKGGSWPWLVYAAVCAVVVAAAAALAVEGVS